MAHKLLFHVSLQNASSPFIFEKTLGLKLLNVLCDDHVTGVGSQDTPHGTCTDRERRVFHQAERTTGVTNTVLFK